MFKIINKTLFRIFNEEAYLNIIVSNTINQSNFTDYEKKLYTKITYGVVENKMLLDFLLKPYLKTLRVKPFVRNTLRIGIYGLTFMKLAPHYLVNELVDMVKEEDYNGSRVVNGVLRSYQRDGYEAGLIRLEQLPKHERISIKYSIPKEIVELLYGQYKRDFDVILSEYDQQKDRTLNTYRINTLKCTPAEMTEWIKYEQIPYQIDGVVLKTPVSLLNHDLFKDGMIIAQDQSSIDIGLKTAVKPGMRVLDACAAPGSKALHMAALMNNQGVILAGDIHEHKIDLILENAAKLGVRIIKPLIADATSYDYGTQYDLVLADVPCSGLGVIMHKPDLKLRMRLAKIETIKELQQKILNNLANFVKKDGYLVYSTCTINKEENEQMITWFLSQHSNYQLENQETILPNAHYCDGFYIAKLKRMN